MAAGAGSNLQISNSYDGTYGSAAVLESFAGRLTPVSTNRISGGFQKVERFTEGSDSQPDLVASIFRERGADGLLSYEPLSADDRIGDGYLSGQYRF